MTQKLVDLICENSTSDQYKRFINLCCTRPAIVQLDEVSSLSSFYDKLSHSDSATLFDGDVLLGHIFDLRGIKLGLKVSYNLSNGSFSASNNSDVVIPVYTWETFNQSKKYKLPCLIGKDSSHKLLSEEINPYLQGRTLIPQLFFSPKNKSLSSNQ